MDSRPSSPLSAKTPPMNPEVTKLGIVSLFGDISSEMLYPITPIFLSTVLGAPVAAIGLIEGVAEATASLLKSSTGRWSDRLAKRKPFIIFGYMLSAVARPVMGLAGSWIDVLLARVLERLGKGIRTSPRDALIAEVVEPEMRGRAFGWHRALDSVGAVLGPLLALLLVSVFQFDLRTMYFVAFVPGLIAVLFIFSVKEKMNAKTEATVEKIAPVAAVTLRNMPKSFSSYMIAWGIFSVCNSSDVFLILKMKESGVSTTITVLLYCFYNVVYAALSTPLGALSDRIGRKKVLLGGLGVFAIVYIGFAAANVIWQFAILLLLYGAYTAATDGVGKAFAVDLLPTSAKGAGLGLQGMVTGFATLFASIIAGLLWQYWGAPATFLFGAVGAALASLLIFNIQLPVEL